MAALDQIAEQMRNQLASVQKGYVNRVLFGGLIIVLERRETTWRLAIGRQGSAPSRTEAEITGRAFAVPAGIEWSWCKRTNRKKRITYQVAECTWVERGSR